MYHCPITPRSNPFLPLALPQINAHNAQLQSWHGGYDSAILRRRESRHVSTCPGGQPVGSLTGWRGDLTPTARKANKIALDESRDGARGYDNRGMHSMVEDGIRERHRSNKLSDTKADYNELYANALKECGTHIEGLTHQQRLRYMPLAHLPTPHFITLPSLPSFPGLQG